MVKNQAATLDPVGFYGFRRTSPWTVPVMSWEIITHDNIYIIIFYYIGLIRNNLDDCLVHPLKCVQEKA
jgi:hypothetical protein